MRFLIIRNKFILSLLLSENTLPGVKFIPAPKQMKNTVKIIRTNMSWIVKKLPRI